MLFRSVIENTYGSVLSGNMIEECNGTAVILDRDCYGITISANVIAHHLGGGVDLRDAWGCAVSANTFTLAHQFGVRVGPDSGRLTISANAFGNSHIGGKEKRPAEADAPMQIDEGAGILIEGASDIAVTGNSFAGLPTAAVHATNVSARVLVPGNSLIDCRRTGEPGAAWLQLAQAPESNAEKNILPPQPNAP